MAPQPPANLKSFGSVFMDLISIKQSHYFSLSQSLYIDPPLGNQAPHKGSSESDERLLLYAAAMVASLRSERDSERRAHEQTRHDAESRIALLEAQLARREAQLETCIIAHSAECIRLPQRPAQSEVKPMQQNEATQVLELTSTVNRSLEAEVNFLAHRVRQTQFLSFVTFLI